ncbi:uncharacterized protein LOC144911017 isoform X2 [Branchiostoma floridae x Branchiostoma belcheri]
MDVASTPVRSKRGKFCPHCSQYVSTRTYFRHKNTHFSQATGHWQTSRVADPLANGSSSSAESESEAETNTVGDQSNDVAGASPLSSPHELQSSSDLSGASSSDDLRQESSSDERHDSDNHEEEIWEGQELEGQLLRNLHSSALAENCERPTKCSREDPIVTLVKWLLTFLLLWQAHNHISDSGLQHLIKFLCPWLEKVGISPHYLGGLSSLYMTWKFLGLNRDNFTKCCVCPDPWCGKLFAIDKLSEITNGVEKPRRCDNIRKVRGRPVRCNTLLARQVITSVSGVRKYYPLKVYCVKSIIETLESFVKRKGFEEKCEQWRSRGMSDSELLGDIFDGQVWKDFQKWNGEDFLSAPRNYGLMLNLDWFQPFKRRNDYSVGVMYMTVMNLPRNERFKVENVILVWILPALESEPKCLTPFLQPVVTELQFLWQGVHFTSYSSPKFPLTFRAALLCCAADIPAARKLCGFLGHAANIGCSKCKKYFEKIAKKTNYSGFDRENWTLRSDAQHRREGLEINQCDNVTRKKALEKTYGTRYTPLMELEYYQSVRFCIIDPMHNLFLGTAKRIFKLWIDKDILNKAKLNKLEKRIGTMNLPNGMGRLPTKISSNHGSFTADEWKNWTLYYSLYCLKDLLPEEHYKCWQIFVLACERLCKPAVSRADVDWADAAFETFGKKVERLFGKMSITPNMHLHCHLKDCILDYGPLHGFWLFSFERYNGLLGSETTNNREIELQIMRKFLISDFAHNLPLPTYLSEVFSPLFERFCSDTKFVDVPNEKERELFLMGTSRTASNVDWARDDQTIKLPPVFTRKALSEDDTRYLEQTYNAMYPNEEINATSMAKVVRNYGTCQVGQELFGSRAATRSRKATHVMAGWLGENGNIDFAAEHRPGVIQNFYGHSVEVNGETKCHVFAVVRWYDTSPLKTSVGNGKPFTVWEKSSVVGGPASFIPVQRLFRKSARAETVMDGKRVVVVCPIARKTFL